MSDTKDKIIEVHALSKLDDIAIRTYYMYQLLDKLIRSNKKTFWERISGPLGIVTTVLSIFAFILKPDLWLVISIIYVVLFLAIFIIPIIEASKSKEQESLEDEVNLGIYLDEAAKYTSQIKLMKSFADSNNVLVKTFIADTCKALQSSVVFLLETIHDLRNDGKYPNCLKEIGRDEKWVEDAISYANSELKE
jgi:ABC-type multidrug transport system fused ATPase/permease subunit